MSVLDVASTEDPPPPFKYVGGDPALDLVNTVDWAEEGPRRDRLTSYARLVTWAEGAGVLEEGIATGLRHFGADNVRGAVGALAEAHRVRRTLRDVFHDVAEGRDPTAALRELTLLLAQTLPRRRLRRATPVAYTWSEWGEHPSCPLWPVIESAANLLTSREAASIGECPGQDCGWMFVDRSRNGMRRWCEMETCGTIAKNRRRRSRQA